ncbi:hypothetical protein BC476_13465 [Vibrio parahaemolyticus]|uniref:restriction endonuclease subunit S n=1 Tax=Vibrio parahaemolyticus TaxID=670 RepID=UPI00083B3089|nr:restriction endonuclease subunit S [Vibrio parahaemolyticus]ODA48049.1 hypothetical protein BC476_13465 [Vibrio parahaemolyticus]
MTKQMNVPKLRFDEFDSCISMRPISEVIKSYRLGGNYGNTMVPNSNPLMKMGNLGRGDFNLNKVEYIDSENLIAEDDEMKYGDLFFNTRNTLELVGKVAIWRKELPRAFYNSNLLRLEFDNNFYFNYVFNSPPRIKALRRVATGTTSVAAVYTRDLLKILVPTPCTKEQQKIASFLSKVDEKIALLTEKKDKLTEYKKGVMQQLFNGKWEEQDGQLIFIPPTLRFKADDGSEFPDWVESRIGDLGHFYYGKSAPKWSVTDEATIPCVRYGELYSKFKGTVDQIYSKTSIPKEKLKFSKGGEVLVPRVGEDPLDFAKCSYLPFSDVAIGEMISVFNTKEDGQFIATYFRATCQKKFARLVEGGNVSNLYFRYLEDVSVCIPSKNEQLKISDFISKVNIKLELLDKELSKAKAWKKGLLQQMFV